MLSRKGGFKIWPLSEGETLNEAKGWEKVIEPSTIVLRIVSVLKHIRYTYSAGCSEGQALV